MERRIGMLPRRRSAFAALAITFGAIAGCGDSDSSAGPERGVTVEEVEEDQYFHEGEYLGQTVTVSAAVSEVLAENRIEVNGTDHGDDSLLVIAGEPLDVAVGDIVRITGTVGQYHVTMEEEGVPPVPYDQYEKYETEAFLYDAKIEPLPAR
jgi:hypothetical protein